jgi:heme exporter protein D
MNGLVSGGWSFVWAAYAITGFVLAAHATRTFTSARRNALSTVR